MAGRHPRGSVKIVITLRLDPDLDADLLAWLSSIPKGERVKALKRALRSGGVTTASTDASEDNGEADEAADNILNAWNY